MSEDNAVDLLRAAQMIAMNELDHRSSDEHDVHYAVVVPLDGPPAIVTADSGRPDWVTSESSPGSAAPDVAAMLVSAVRGMRDGLRAVALVSAGRGNRRVDLLLEEHTSTVTEHMRSIDVSSGSWIREDARAVIWEVRD